MIMPTTLTPLQQERIIKIIDMFFPHATVYLFGSHARGDSTATSDIDIAIDIGTRLPSVEHHQMLNMIDALDLVQRIDLVDFQAVPDEMKKLILKEGIL